MNRGLAPIWLCALLIGCGVFVTDDEVSRATGPTGTVDAVLVERNAGATVDFIYVAHVVKKGGSLSEGTRVARFYGARRNDLAYGVNLRWKDASTLWLEFYTATRQTLEREVVPIGDLTVTVRLKPKTKDNKALPGGMLYNLERPLHE